MGETLKISRATFFSVLMQQSSFYLQCVEQLPIFCFFLTLCVTFSLLSRWRSRCALGRVAIVPRQREQERENAHTGHRDSRERNRLFLCLFLSFSILVSSKRLVFTLYTHTHREILSRSSFTIAFGLSLGREEKLTSARKAVSENYQRYSVTHITKLI